MAWKCRRRLMFCSFTGKLLVIAISYHMAFIEERSIKNVLPFLTFGRFCKHYRIWLFRQPVCMRNRFWCTLRGNISWNNCSISKLPYGKVSLTFKEMFFPWGHVVLVGFPFSPSVYINHSQVVQLTWRQPVPRSLARGKICLFLPSNFPFELRSLATY